MSAFPPVTVLTVCMSRTEGKVTFRLKVVVFAAVLAHLLCEGMTLVDLLGKLTFAPRLTLNVVTFVVNPLVLTVRFMRVVLAPEEWCTTLAGATLTTQLWLLMLAIALLLIPIRVGMENAESPPTAFALQLTVTASAPNAELGLQELEMSTSPRVLPARAEELAGLNSGYE